MFNFYKLSELIDFDWNDFNSASSTGTFLNTLEWIEFQKSLGKKIEEFVVKKNDQVCSIFYVEIWNRRVSKYGYLPRGPVISDEILNDEGLLKTFFTELNKFGKDFTKKHKLNAFRIDPIIDIHFQSLLKKTGWKQSLALGQVKNTWMIKLDKNIKEIFNDQKKDTRYYIKRAEKKGVKIVRAETEEQVLIFNKLMRETKERNEFHGFDDRYYLSQWENLRSENRNESLCEIFLAEFEGKYISGALINFSKNIAHYAHGASTSDPELSKLASPYLLLWKCIEYSQDLGKEYFDFWGVIPKGVNHPWRGLSDFKMKFEGDFVQYTGTFDTYSNPFKYYFNRLIDWKNYRGLRY